MFNTLFPSLLFTLAVFLGLEHEAVSSRHPKYVVYHRKKSVLGSLKFHIPANEGS